MVPLNPIFSSTPDFLSALLTTTHICISLFLWIDRGHVHCPPTKCSRSSVGDDVVGVVSLWPPPWLGNDLVYAQKALYFYGFVSQLMRSKRAAILGSLNSRINESFVGTT